MSTRRILVLAVDAGARQNQKPDEEPGWQASGFALAFNSELRSLSDYDSWWLHILTDSQIRVEHALNLRQCETVLFVTPLTLETDTERKPEPKSERKPEPESEPENAQPPRPYVFEALELPKEHSLESSGGALSPQDVMHTLRTLTSRDTLPACFQLSVRYDSNEVAPTHFAATVRFLEQLFIDTEPSRWQNMRD